jgi:hypothetical protein
MFARLNFLLGFGLLVLLVFYFAFAWVILPPLQLAAPDWARTAGALAVLVSIGLTVQALAIATGTLAGVASYGRHANAAAIASQAAMLVGHGALAWSCAPWLAGGEPPSRMALATTAALYAIGVAAGLLEWRTRRGAGGQRT